MIDLLGQMFRLPLLLMVSGTDAFATMLRQVQVSVDRGIESISPTHRGGREIPDGARRPMGESQPRERCSVADPITPFFAVIPAKFGTADPGVGASQESDSTPPQCERPMRDTDLSGKDELKLVRYKVLFIKRDLEYAFPEKEELVHDDLDGQAFTSWKIAEFIQDLQSDEPDRRHRVPSKWNNKNYPTSSATEPNKYRKNGYLLGLPEEDKKFLRLFYEVLDRYAREPFEHQEEQIKVLKEIRDQITESGRRI
jgi:hypothetical protein